MFSPFMGQSLIFSSKSPFPLPHLFRTHIKPHSFPPPPIPPFHRFLQPNSPKMPLTCSDCPKCFCSLLIPPIGVWMEKGCSIHLLINVLLTICGYFPGLIHAIIIICYY